MSELLFTGQVPIPDLAGGVEKTSQILQNALTLRARQQALQAQQMRATTAQASRTMSKLYGKGLANVHESAVPFARQAIEMTAQRIRPLLMLPNGFIEAERIMRNTFDAIDRYADSEAWHTAEQKAAALIDPNSPEYKAEVKGMKFFRPNVTLESVAAQSRRARGGDVLDMALDYQEDGNFRIVGTDVGTDGLIDISQHKWFNNPNEFQYSVMPVSVRDSQTIGQKAGEEHKKLKNNSATVKADVEKNAFENGTLPVDFEGLRAEDPKFEPRVNAFLRDKDDILGGYPNMDQEDLFALYEFKDPILFSTSDEDGLSALGRRLTRSVREEAKRQGEFAYYPPDDEDGENIDKLREDTYNTGFKSEEKFSQVLPGAPGIESTRNVATFPLRTLQTKAFDEIEVMVPNPEYDNFLKTYGSEAALVDLATAGVSVPKKEIPRKIDGLTLREDSPNLIQVDIFGSDEKYTIDLNAVVLNEQERNLKKALLGAFDKIGLTFDGFRQKANELWGVDTGEPTESVRSTLTGNPRK
jgi:hypothetical protein